MNFRVPSLSSFLFAGFLVVSITVSTPSLRAQTKAESQAKPRLRRSKPQDYWVASAGIFNAPDAQGVNAFGLEYRTPIRIFKTGRVLTGLVGGPKNHLYGYAGFYWDLDLTKKWVFTPSLALGGLQNGDKTRLGGGLQFRTNLELSYRIDSRQRIGLALSHLSNAEIKQPNKGINSQLLTYTVAFGRK